MSLQERFWSSCREGDLKSLKSILGTKEGLKSLSSKDESGWTCLLRSIVEYREDVTDILINRSSLDDLEQRGPTSQTALIVAAQWGNLKALKSLIRCGSRIDSRDEEGMTSLMWSSKEGHWDVVKELLANKADIFMRDKCNRSAHDWFVRGCLRRESCCPGCGRTGDPDLTSSIRSMLSRDETFDKRTRKRKGISISEEMNKRRKGIEENVIDDAVAV